LIDGTPILDIKPYLPRCPPLHWRTSPLPQRPILSHPIRSGMSERANVRHACETRATKRVRHACATRAPRVIARRRGHDLFECATQRERGSRGCGSIGCGVVRYEAVHEATVADWVDDPPVQDMCAPARPVPPLPSTTRALSAWLADSVRCRGRPCIAPHLRRDPAASAQGHPKLRPARCAEPRLSTRRPLPQGPRARVRLCELGLLVFGWRMSSGMRRAARWCSVKVVVSEAVAAQLAGAVPSLRHLRSCACSAIQRGHAVAARTRSCGGAGEHGRTRGCGMQHALWHHNTPAWKADLVHLALTPFGPPPPPSLRRVSRASSEPCGDQSARLPPAPPGWYQRAGC
jgi:hypothetical protein